MVTKKMQKETTRDRLQKRQPSYRHWAAYQAIHPGRERERERGREGGREGKRGRERERERERSVSVGICRMLAGSCRQGVDPQLSVEPIQ